MARKEQGLYLSRKRELAGLRFARQEGKGLQEKLAKGWKLLHVISAIGRDHKKKVRTMSEANITTDHLKIKRWVEQRGGHPARVEGTAVRGSSGVLVLDYGDPTSLELEPITWDDFFEGFEENRLAFLYPADDEVRFAKLVGRTDPSTDYTN